MDPTKRCRRAGPWLAQQWQHVVLTFDTTEGRLHVDGALLTTVPLAGPIAYPDLDLLLCGQHDRVYYYEGYVDEVAMWDRALTELEIASVYGWYVDEDTDGYNGDDDCGPDDPSIHVGAAEGIADGVDNDCDGTELCYADADEDGFGEESTVASLDLDCDDPGEAVASNDTCPGFDDRMDTDEDGIPDGCDPVDSETGQTDLPTGQTADTQTNTADTAQATDTGQTPATGGRTLPGNHRSACGCGSTPGPTPWFLVGVLFVPIAGRRSTVTGGGPSC